MIRSLFLFAGCATGLPEDTSLEVLELKLGNLTNFGYPSATWSEFTETDYFPRNLSTLEATSGVNTTEEFDSETLKQAVVFDESVSPGLVDVESAIKLLSLSSDVWWRYGVDFFPQDPSEAKAKDTSQPSTTSSESPSELKTNKTTPPKPAVRHITVQKGDSRPQSWDAALQHLYQSVTSGVFLKYTIFYQLYQTVPEAVNRFVYPETAPRSLNSAISSYFDRTKRAIDEQRKNDTRNGVPPDNGGDISSTKVVPSSIKKGFRSKGKGFVKTKRSTLEDTTSIWGRKSRFPGSEDYQGRNEEKAVKKKPKSSSLSELIKHAKSQGKGVRIQRIERFGGHIRELYLQFQEYFGQRGFDVGFNIYYSPGNLPSTSLPGHSDDMHEFVIHLAGRKEWTFSSKPVKTSEGEQQESEEGKCSADSSEESCSPTNHTMVLTPGISMFVPKGVWHVTSALEGEESLHLAIGVKRDTQGLAGLGGRSMFFSGPPEAGSFWDRGWENRWKASLLLLGYWIQALLIVGTLLCCFSKFAPIDSDPGGRGSTARDRRLAKKRGDSAKVDEEPEVESELLRRCEKPPGYNKPTKAETEEMPTKSSNEALLMAKNLSAARARLKAAANPLHKGLQEDLRRAVEEQDQVEKELRDDSPKTVLTREYKKLESTLEESELAFEKRFGKLSGS